MAGNPIELERVSAGRAMGARGAPLQDLTLSVAEGASLGLVGPNGSGKSTLLRVLACLVRPTAGRALVCGFDTRLDPIAARRRVGYVPEQLRLGEHTAELQVRQYLVC